MKKNKKIIPLVAAAFMLLTGSLAMFSDFVSRETDMSTGSLAVQVLDWWTPTDSTENEDLGVGFVKDLSNVKIKNVGTMDGQFKVIIKAETDPVTGLSDEVFVIGEPTDFNTHYTTIESNVGGIPMSPGEERTLSSFAPYNFSLYVNHLVGNDAQGRTGRVVLEVYARKGSPSQSLGETDWPAEPELTLTSELGELLP